MDTIYTRETHGISEEVMRNTCGRHKVTVHSAVTAEIEDGAYPDKSGRHYEKGIIFISRVLWPPL